MKRRLCWRFRLTDEWGTVDVSKSYEYIRDGAEIYRRSFAIIRREADLARFTSEEEQVAVRLLHACGMDEVAADVPFSTGAVPAARAALHRDPAICCLSY